MTKFKQFERYPTRNGGAALILAILPGGRMPAALYTDGEFDRTTVYGPDGRIFSDEEMPDDILPPEPEKRTEWRNIYRGFLDGSLLFGTGSYRTRELADRYAETASDGARNSHGDIILTRVGCHPIELRAEFVDDPEALR